MSTFIVNTSLAQMQPVGADGERLLGRTAELLTRYLSPRHAALLAEPVPLRDGSGIDWYTEEEGDILPLSALSSEDAQKVRSLLVQSIEEIRAKAESLAGEGGGRVSSAAAVLRHATVFPDEGCIYAIRDADGGLWPLLVGWGYQSHDPAKAQAFQLSTFGAVRSGHSAETPPSRRREVGQVTQTVAATGNGQSIAEPPSVNARPASVAVAGGGSLWPSIVAGLVAVLALALIMALLLPACGLRTPFGTITFGLPGGIGCPVAAIDAAPVSTGNALERELAVLSEQYRERRSACNTSASNDLRQEPADSFDQRVDRRGEAQVTLIWDSIDDLDLAVRCPDGRFIAYASKRNCGGELDIDKNDSDAALTPMPVENITFRNGTDGSVYPIFVNLYKRRGVAGQPVPFRLRIREGDETREIAGTVDTPRQPVAVGEIR